VCVCVRACFSISNESISALYDWHSLSIRQVVSIRDPQLSSKLEILCKNCLMYLQIWESQWWSQHCSFLVRDVMLLCRLVVTLQRSLLPRSSGQKSKFYSLKAESMFLYDPGTRGSTYLTLLLELHESIWKATSCIAIQRISHLFNK
jgi:hypothetical protein